MADSIREKIMKNIKTVLQTITVGNGYSNTILSVQRFIQSGHKLLDVPVILISEGSETAEDKAPNLTMKTLSVYLAVITRQDETIDTRSGAEVMNSIVADVEKAMVADFTRGGNSIDTKIISSDPIDVQDGEPELGVLMQFEIIYRHGRTDPTSII